MDGIVEIMIQFPVKKLISPYSATLGWMDPCAKSNNLYLP